MRSEAHAARRAAPRRVIGLSRTGRARRRIRRRSERLAAPAAAFPRPAASARARGQLRRRRRDGRARRRRTASAARPPRRTRSRAPSAVTNPRSLRFCVTCGHLLAAPSQPPATPFAAATGPSSRTGSAPPARSAPVQHDPAARLRAAAGSAQPPIAPARVVDLGTPAAEAMLRLCPRCRGGSDPTSQFCRFCGALARRGRVDRAGAAHAAAAAPSAFAATVESSVYVPPTPAPPGPMRPSPTPVRSTVAMVSPVAGPAARARLVLIARDGGEGPGYPLGEATDIGRTEGNILLGDDRYVSPRHARIQVRGGVVLPARSREHQRRLHAHPFRVWRGGRWPRRAGRSRRTRIEAARREPVAAQSRAANRGSRLVPGGTTGAKV